MNSSFINSRPILSRTNWMYVLKKLVVVFAVTLEGSVQDLLKDFENASARLNHLWLKD